MQKFGTLIDNLRTGAPISWRHQNPYLNEALHFKEYLFTQQQLPAQFATLFAQQQPLILEIGCYQGKNLLEFAQANQDKNFLGLDITYKRVVKSARKLAVANLNNARVALCDAKFFIHDVVPDKALQGICIFFPDPWPKGRHTKNRLITEQFLDSLLPKLATGGFFWFKTDQEHLLHTVQSTLREKLQVVNIVQPDILNGGPFETQFQKIFRLKNVPYYQEIFIKT